MTADDMAQPATLFKGLDTEKFSLHRDSMYFRRLDDALRHAMEKLTSDERYGAYIRRERDHSQIAWLEIENLYRALGSN